jgi:uncharacterized membrane protein YebE (DUF533 family)
MSSSAPTKHPMKPSLLLRLLVVALATTVGGCAGPTSAIEPKAKNRVTVGDAAALGGGAVAGAVAGNAVAGKTGAAVGGVVGLATAAVVKNAITDSQAQDQAEAEARGERRARSEIFEEMWKKAATSNPSTPSGPTDPSTDVAHYPGGTVEGVKFSPRAAPSPGLVEPVR